MTTASVSADPIQCKGVVRNKTGQPCKLFTRDPSQVCHIHRRYDIDSPWKVGPESVQCVAWVLKTQHRPYRQCRKRTRRGSQFCWSHDPELLV